MEKIQPVRDLEAEARLLILDGWHSTSNRYCHLARFKTPKSLIFDLLKDRVVNTPEGKYVIGLWERWGLNTLNLRCPPEGLEVENMDLGNDQELFRTFKRLGGPAA